MQIGPYNLRECQLRGIDKARQSIASLIHSGREPRVLLQAPCGYGKTLCSTAMMSMLKPGKKGAFIASGRILLFQKSKKMSECYLPHSVVMANVQSTLDENGDVYAREFSKFNPPEFHQCYVISKDTLVSREIDLKNLDVSLVIVDEAHLGMSEQWREIIDIGVPIVGLTATPATGKGKGLGDFYNDLVIGATYEELIQEGFLTPCKVFIPYTVELKRNNGEKVKVSNNGEYVQSHIDEVFNRQELIGDAVRTWREHGNDKPTLIYASSVDHSIALSKEFNTQGIPSEHVDANTPQVEREDIYRRFQNGGIQVISNYGVLRVGADFPCAEVVQLMVSMNSLNAYLQTVGRGLRIYPGKTFCKIIDHGGNVVKHGWPTEDRLWPLDPGDTVSRLKKNGEKDPDPPKIAVCPKCKAEKGGQKKCPHCGYEYVRSGIMVRAHDGSFKEITPEQVKKKKQSSDAQKLWMMCLGVMAAKNQTVAAAMAMFRNKYGGPLPSNVGPQPEVQHYRMPVSAVWPGFNRKKKANV